MCRLVGVAQIINDMTDITGVRSLIRKFEANPLVIRKIRVRTKIDTKNQLCSISKRLDKLIFGNNYSEISEL